MRSPIIYHGIIYIVEKNALSILLCLANLTVFLQSMGLLDTQENCCTKICCRTTHLERPSSLCLGCSSQQPQVTWPFSYVVIYKHLTIHQSSTLAHLWNSFIIDAIGIYWRWMYTVYCHNSTLYIWKTYKVSWCIYKRRMCYLWSPDERQNQFFVINVHLLFF